MADELNGFMILGIGIFIMGLIWLVWDNIIDEFWTEWYISSPYLDLMHTGFNIGPIATLFLGVIILLGGMKKR